MLTLIGPISYASCLCMDAVLYHAMGSPLGYLPLTLPAIVHSVLPCEKARGREQVSGALFHTKFLACAVFACFADNHFVLQHAMHRHHGLRVLLLINQDISQIWS